MIQEILGSAVTSDQLQEVQYDASSFDLDVLACPRCGGRMRLLATIEDPRIIREILAHLGLPTEVPYARSPRPPPAGPADLFSDMSA